MRGENDTGGSPRRVGPEFSSIKRRRRSSGGTVWAVAAVLLLAGAAGTGYYLLTQGPDEEPSPDPRQALEADDLRDEADEDEDGDEEGEPEKDADEEESAEAEERPGLDASDSLVRDLAVEVSQHPELAEWLAPEDLSRRFVAATVNVAAGASPTDHVEHMDPGGRFQVLDQGNRFIIDPAAWQRYDVLAETVASLDTRGTARMYRQLSPYFEEAYEELGLGRDDSFDDVFARALGQLLAPSPPSPPVEVEPFDAGYEYRDPELADLSDAQKHLLRMGPDNMREVQTKLRAISEELGIEPVYP